MKIVTAAATRQIIVSALSVGATRDQRKHYDDDTISFLPFLFCFLFLLN